MQSEHQEWERRARRDAGVLRVEREVEAEVWRQARNRRGETMEEDARDAGQVEEMRQEFVHQVRVGDGDSTTTARLRVETTWDERRVSVPRLQAIAGEAVRKVCEAALEGTGFEVVPRGPTFEEALREGHMRRSEDPLTGGPR